MPADEHVRAHLLISGHVQGVYFRAQTARLARAGGLAGWVRNVGTEVEAEFEGPREAVDRLIAWCHGGPPQAAVERVEITWTEPQQAAGFSIR